MQVDIGGDRLGSGSKETVDLRTFNRSTFNQNYVWKSTTASGTLVPFLCELALPGDTFNIDLNCDIMTHPTVGPLFGSYKVQLDVFKIPIRLYNADLHMNKLGIGLKMNEIKLPQVHLTARTNPEFIQGDNSQINPSSIFSYLGIRGIGLVPFGSTTEPLKTNGRDFNAVPYLAYAEIYKQYYANKQEEIGVIIHNPMEATNATLLQAWYNEGIDNQSGLDLILVPLPVNIIFPIKHQMNFYYDIATTTGVPDIQGIQLTFDGIAYSPDQIYNEIEWDTDWKAYFCRKPKSAWQGVARAYQARSNTNATINDLDRPQLKTFPLSNIDDMRSQILRHDSSTGTFTITNNSIEPYNLPIIAGTVENEPNGPYSKLSSQEGLFVKTYQSDLFNNWISTEWIDGDNGINQITSIDTTSGSFTIDTLNLATKVYAMLNSIAISGGTYDDWLVAVYRQERYKSEENPVYMGSLIKELAFEEITSYTASDTSGTTQPLGTLAGKGRLTGKHKGGTIKINIDEPSYVMGIFSLTPKISYSQGNKWDTNLKTLDDFHKPHLTGIGYQDLITDGMAWWDTEINVATNALTFKSAGKQPAWINYMTNVDRNYGNFAVENNEMFMTLNRKYGQNRNDIIDLTTYIDPSKFNNIFAQTSLDAQNFWVQIAVGLTKRSKMSAKQIPHI